LLPGAVSVGGLEAPHPGLRDLLTGKAAWTASPHRVAAAGSAAERARGGIRDAYEANGSGAGMAAFIAMTSWRGEFADEYFAQPAPDPSAFGMPSEDDGSRDDPLLSDRSWAVSSYRPDVDRLAVAPTRIVIAVGEESLDTFGGEFGYAGQPEAFARKLRDVLDNN
jgi:hypothetical protein